MTVLSDTHPDRLDSKIAAHDAEGSAVHPLFHAGKWLVADLLSTLTFVGLFAITHSVYLATGLAIGAGVVQIGYFRMRRQPIDAMQWMSLGLVAVFGGASLVTHDPRFIMVKPSLIYIVVGVVMLKRGWMTRYMPPVALAWGRDVITVFGYLWAAMMFLTAASNFGMAAYGDAKSWAWFVGVFPVASKLTLFGVQYVATRVIVRRRMLAAA